MEPKSDLILSYSQLQTFSACEAKFFYERVFKRRNEGTIQTAKGSLIHLMLEKLAVEDKINANDVLDEFISKTPGYAPFRKALENWLPTAKQLIATLYSKKLLARATNGYAAESQFTGSFGKRKDAGRTYHFVGAVDGFRLDGRVLIVRDYKFKGKKNFLSTEDEIARDRQLRMYVHFIYSQIPEGEEKPSVARISHIYLIEATKEVMEVAAEVPIEEIINDIEEDVAAVSTNLVNKYATVVAEIRKKIGSEETSARLTDSEVNKAQAHIKKVTLNYNTTECYSFGGCPHKEYCPGYAASTSD